MERIPKIVLYCIKDRPLNCFTLPISQSPNPHLSFITPEFFISVALGLDYSGNCGGVGMLLVQIIHIANRVMTVIARESSFIVPGLVTLP